MIVIKALQGHISSPWPIEMMIADTLVRLQRFEAVKIYHTPRSANLAADFVARSRHSLEQDQLANLPELLVLICKDALG